MFCVWGVNRCCETPDTNPSGQRLGTLDEGSRSVSIRRCLVIGRPVTCGDPTTSPMCWPAFIGCVSLRGIEFKIAVLTYKVVHGLAPGYLGPLTRVADLPSRRSLRSVGTNRLVVPTSRLSTVGSRAFPITSQQIWNYLPEDVTSAESLTTFRRLLKTHLFRKSFPDYLLDINWLSPVDLAVVLLHRSSEIDWLIDWSCFPVTLSAPAAFNPIQWCVYLSESEILFSVVSFCGCLSVY